MVLFVLIEITGQKINLLEETHRNCDKISGCCQLYKIHTFHGASPSILGGTWKFKADLKRGELRKVITLWESCDPQGHHAFGKYLTLFTIIYTMVKLGLVL